MFVKRYQLKNFKWLLVDEMDRAVGEIRDADFDDCLESNKTFVEDGYTFYHVNKQKVEHYVLALSQKKEK